MESTQRDKLLNQFQRDFPLVERPFEKIALELGASESEVLSDLRGMTESGVVSRVGPVIAPKRFGASTLAAISVSPGDLDRIAEIVNGFPEVNHNYEREGALNLWFVVNAKDDATLAATLSEISKRTGLQVHDLRLEEEFRIDLGFDLKGDTL